MEFPVPSGDIQTKIVGATLYDKIKWLDETKKNPLILELLGAETVEDVDDRSIRAELLNAYRENDFVEQGLEGHPNPVSDAYRLIAERYKGLGRILPRMKDYAANGIVDELAELVGDVSHLERRGFWSPDNFVMGAVEYGSAGILVGLGLAGVVASWALLEGDMTMDSGSFREIAGILAYSFGSAGALVGGIYAQTKRSSGIHDFSSRTELIDENIRIVREYMNL